MKKEYVSPKIMVRNVRLKNYFLGTSTSFKGIKQGEACENWTNNMEDVLGPNSGGFHNTFGVDNTWGEGSSGL